VHITITLGIIFICSNLLRVCLSSGVNVSLCLTDRQDSRISVMSTSRRSQRAQPSIKARKESVAKMAFDGLRLMTVSVSSSSSSSSSSGDSGSGSSCRRRHCRSGAAPAELIKGNNNM